MKKKGLTCITVTDSDSDNAGRIPCRKWPKRDYVSDYGLVTSSAPRVPRSAPWTPSTTSSTILAQHMEVFP